MPFVSHSRPSRFLLFVIISIQYLETTASSAIDIPVNIQLKPAKYLYGKDYIATDAEFTATAEILDEKYKNLTITYQWSTKNTTIVTDAKASQITYKFTQPDEDNFLKVLVIHDANYTGTSEKKIVVRNPIQITEPENNKLFLEHGELLDISFKLNGTGPITSCYRFCYEMADTDKCKCKPDSLVRRDEIRISHYLHYVGNYTLLIAVDNVADHVEKHYTVKIIDTVHSQTAPYVPIVSSILAVIILLTGIALHMKFKKTVQTETADFDFIRSYEDDDLEDWGEVQTLSQRVRYLLFKADQHNDHEASLNNYSSHYGSFQRIN